jgi:hypothetical protein
MEVLLVIFVWWALAFAAGIYAQRLRRRGALWALGAILMSPLLAFVFLLALGPRNG